MQGAALFTPQETKETFDGIISVILWDGAALKALNAA